MGIFGTCSFEKPAREGGDELKDPDDAEEEEGLVVRGKDKESHETNRFSQGYADDEERKRLLRVCLTRQYHPAEDDAQNQRTKRGEPLRIICWCWRICPTLRNKEIDDEDPNLERSPQGPPDDKRLFGRLSFCRRWRTYRHTNVLSQSFVG